HNHKDWKQLYASLLGQDFDCRALLQFVRKVPSAFSDYHWKSMAENLYHGERLLVQRIYTIEKLDQLTNDLSRYVGRDLILRHHLKTSAIDAHDIRAEVSRLAPEIEQAYAADVELYDAVEQAGGVLTNVR
ncbi:MAG: hypothetical protein ACPHUF_11150, partial [Gammaproteobacteria bacterium]